MFALSGPSVQLGLSVTLLSSTLGAKELNAGRDAVLGLNKPLFLPPYKKPTRNHITDTIAVCPYVSWPNRNILTTSVYTFPGNFL